ncbi:MAG: Gfo/Idh/MocA family oxidoreductase [Bryobacteraceae bacterium]
MKTAIVGCGKVGHIHAAALVSLEESQFVGVCDADAGRAAAFAAQYGAQPFTDVRTMVSATGTQALMVCTPHPQHAPNTVDAVECGAHVLIEKPMAASLEDCDRMLAAARAAGKTLGIVSQRRFYEPVVRMKRAIEEGRIGRPALGMMTMLSWRDEAYYRSDPWRGTWAGEGGGVLVNQSPHQLDILRWLMGDVEEVTGYWANVNHPSIEVEDTAVAALRFRGGGLASVVTSVSQRPGIYTKVHVHGSSGASVGVQTDGGSTFIAGMSGIQEPPVNDIWTIPGEEGKLAEWQAEDRARFASMDPIAHYHGLQIRDFLQALEEGRAPLVTGEEGRAVTEIFTAIYRAQETGRPVRLPL